VGDYTESTTAAQEVSPVPLAPAVPVHWHRRFFKSAWQARLEPVLRADIASDDKVIAAPEDHCDVRINWGVFSSVAYRLATVISTAKRELRLDRPVYGSMPA